MVSCTQTLWCTMRYVMEFHFEFLDIHYLVNLALFVYFPENQVIRTCVPLEFICHDAW